MAFKEFRWLPFFSAGAFFLLNCHFLSFLSLFVCLFNQKKNTFAERKYRQNIFDRRFILFTYLFNTFFWINK